MSESEQHTKTSLIVEALKSGGVLTIDWPDWRIDSAHCEKDSPAQFDVEDDSMLDEQQAWWDSIRICGAPETPTEQLIEALALLAGLSIRRP